MAKVLNLFGEEFQPVAKKEKVTSTSQLNLIVIPKKGKEKEMPVEKEMKKFNRLVKELNEIEEAEKKKAIAEEEYNQQFNLKVIPKLIEVSKIQLNFVRHIESIFYSEKANKALERKFVAFVITVLEDAAEYNNETHLELGNYLKKQMLLMSKKDQEHLIFLMNKDGVDVDIENLKDFNVEEQARKMADEFDYESFTKQQHEAMKGESIIKKMTPDSIQALYKELAKMLHPDLEKDENIRKEKEALMKELIAAKENGDLYSLLLIKQKAQQLNEATNATATYSLEELKKYNKLLKQKLDQHKHQARLEIMNQFYMENGLMMMREKAKDLSTEVRIKNELEELDQIEKGLQQNLIEIKSRQDIELLMQMADY